MNRLAAAAFVLFLLAPLGGVASAQQPSPDRIVAEWMVRMGGSVVLEGQRKPIFDLADLPATDFRIHALNFTGITMYAASLQDELRRLPALPHLKELYINGRLWYDQPAPRVAATISAVQRGDAAREARAQQAGSDLHPLQRPRAQGPFVAEDPEGSADSSDAQLRHLAQPVSAHAPRPELRRDLQRRGNGQSEGHEDADEAVLARHVDYRLRNPASGRPDEPDRARSL